MKHVAALMGMLGLSSWTSVALGQEVRVSFDDAVAAAAQNPRVRGDRRAATLLRRSADQSPALDANPIATLTGGARVAPAGEQGFEGGVAVTQSVSAEGAARLRRDALGAEARWMGAESDAEALTRCLAAASAWLALRDAEEQRELTTRALDNERAFLALVARLATAGERTAADLAVATTGVEEASLRGRLAEGAVVDARARVAAEVGTPERGAVVVTEGATPEVAVPSAREQEVLLAGAAMLPAVRARTLLAHAESMRALEERALRGTRLTLGVEVRRDALRATVVQASLAVPLPFFAVGDREYAARQATSLRLEGEAADEQARARVALALAAHEVEHAGEVYEALRGSVVPASARAVALRERLLVGGEGTVLEVIDARRTLLDAASRLVRATRDRAWARIRLVSLLRALRGAA